ncbi:hypothetical protein ScPMuIL_005665 [Solemya velum]
MIEWYREKITLFAVCWLPNPDKNKNNETITKLRGEPTEPNRNVLVESARIARGEVTKLSTLHAKDFDAVIFPGGFGAAKNLSTYAVDGADMKINGDVERILKEFHSSSKPIGLCCIAPVLAAKVISNCQVTVGSDQEEEGRWPYAGTAKAIEKLGATHVKKDVTDICVDEKNRIVTTPAFMCKTAVHEIFDGIGNMVQSVLKLTK